jgi:hypothetical protein
MAVFAISDLHLSKAIDKPMDIFGGGWENYMDKIENNWKEAVSDGDWVLIPGDISWATYLEETSEDFKFLAGLPGKKVIIKGNHDYWWTTLSKLNNFLVEKKIEHIYFLHNNSYICDSIAVCGTRGWIGPDSSEFTEHDVKIYRRELYRLELSLQSLKGKDYDEIVVMLHYPPLYTNGKGSDFLELMKEYGVKKCIYGHLHGPALRDAVEGMIDGIQFLLTSCDRINFTPVRMY